MRLDRPLLLIGLLVAVSAMPSCAGVQVSPQALREAKGIESEAGAALANWKEAVVLANEFLASPYRCTLPAGSFELRDSGMQFVTAQGRWPIEMWWTPWGNFVVWTGGGAQEASYGFVVGARTVQGRKSNPVLDNSFFRKPDGGLRDPFVMALMILHETTHVVHGVGTVGFWSSWSYYLELIFLFRSSTNTSERRPHATSEEFANFHLAKEASDESQRRIYEGGFQEHLKKGGPNCEHGPFSEPLVPPIVQ